MAASILSTKVCRTCKAEKPRSQFDFYPKGGLQKICIPCRDLKEQYRIARPCKVCEVVTPTHLLRDKHCKACLMHLPYMDKAYRQACRAREAERKGRVFTPGKCGPRTNPETAIRKAEQEQARKERVQARTAKRSLQPWSAVGLTKAEQFRLRYRFDAEFNLRQRMRAAFKRKRQGIRLGELLRSAINRNGNSPRAEQFVGYTAHDMRVHLEKQFTKGMTWDAFCEGRIHIDHIVPLSSFDVSDEGELKSAWALTNLRPLWAKDNLAKRAARTHLL